MKRKALLISAVSLTGLLTSCDTDKLAEDLSSTAEGLLPNIWITLTQVLIFIVVVAAVFFLAYKPIKKKMAERQKFVQSNIDESVKAKKEAESNIKASKEVLDKAQVQAGDIIKKAQTVAEENAAKAQQDLAASIERQKVQAHKDLQDERRRMIQSAHEEIVDTAIAASKEILSKEIDEEANRKLVNDFIDRLNDTKESQK